jgi:hypothetical protein
MYLSLSMHYGIFPQIIENSASFHQASSATFLLPSHFSIHTPSETKRRHSNSSSNVEDVVDSLINSRSYRRAKVGKAAAFGVISHQIFSR